MILELQVAEADAMGEGSRIEIESHAVSRSVIAIGKGLVCRTERADVAVCVVREAVKEMHVGPDLPIQFAQ